MEPKKAESKRRIKKEEQCWEMQKGAKVKKEVLCCCYCFTWKKGMGEGGLCICMCMYWRGGGGGDGVKVCVTSYFECDNTCPNVLVHVCMDMCICVCQVQIGENSYCADVCVCVCVCVCACICVVSVIVKCSGFPPHAVDRRYRYPLHCYYYNLRETESDVHDAKAKPAVNKFLNSGHPRSLVPTEYFSDAPKYNMTIHSL